MTKQESFKLLVRNRMAKTGERYAAARQSLIDQAEARQKASKHSRIWVSEPDISDEKITEATGKSFNEWCDIIDEWDGDRGDHTALAKHVREDLGVGPWWAQGVTVAYERITGLRLPYQRKDGTFAASKSKTIGVSANYLQNLITSDDDRADLFPGKSTSLLSRPGSKTLRIDMGTGVALLGVSDLGDGRSKVTIEHEKLPTYDDVQEWKFYWSEWLEAIDVDASQG